MIDRRPLTQAEHLSQLAYEAWQRGQSALDRSPLDQAVLDQAVLDQGALDGAALGGSGLGEARRWLERAHRIAPDDLTVALSLATTRFRMHDASARALFAAVADGSDLPEALLGLAAAHHAAGDNAGAAAALHRLLSTHALPVTATPSDLLGAVTRAAGRRGWCSFGVDGLLRVELSGAGRIALSLDGIQVTGRLPWRVPRCGRALAVIADGEHLLGSPIALDRIRRVEGFVQVRGDGLDGWAWLPAAAEIDPEITIRAVDRARPILSFVATSTVAVPSRAFARAREFRLALDELPAADGVLRITGPDGRDLWGSPLDPRAERRSAITVTRGIALATFGRSPGRMAPAPFAAVAADIVGRPAQARLAPQRRVTVIVPVYSGLAATRACLAAVLATVPDGTRVIAVDDATPEPALAAMLDELRAQRRITLIRHAQNKGFPASANAGLRSPDAGGRDVVLLNSDTIVTPGWLERLRAAVHAAPDVGTATPFSNDASIVSYPKRDGGNPVPDGRSLSRLARLAARANPDATIDIPTGVGFCMYLRRECLDEIGLLREDVFAQGYGEENDFCIRARHLGWRHIAVPAAYVAHVGGQSFGGARAHLIARNLDVLERLHPGYGALIGAFDAADPLARARRNLDMRRWSAGRVATGAVVIVTHDSGGGVERVVRERCDAARAAGLRPIVLRPIVDRNPDLGDGDRRYIPGVCRVDDGAGEGYPNLRFVLPDEIRALVGLLRRDRPVAVEIHHLLGHHPAMLELAALLDVPCDVVAHDYAWICPRISLLAGNRRYCGEPTDVAVCEACVADAGRAIEEDISVAELRARSARVLGRARRVVTPSSDAASRLLRYFPDIRPEIIVHEDDTALPPLMPTGRGKLRVCILGAIGVEKGYDVLLACARDIAARRLPMEFVVVGHTVDDIRLMATGAAFVTGPYKDDEAVALVRAQGASLGFLPSIWPETWCFTLQHLWRAGLRVVAFDIGAIAERVRRANRGFVLPLGLPPAAINNALLAVQPLAGDECGRRRQA